MIRFVRYTSAEGAADGHMVFYKYCSNFSDKFYFIFCSPPYGILKNQMAVFQDGREKVKGQD